MARISKKDLDDLTSKQIKDFYTTEDIFDLDMPIIGAYVDGGRSTNTVGNRMSRVRNILNLIVVERFISGTL